MQKKSKAQVFGSKGEDSKCNLCNKPLRMSQAHVPPQSCIEQDRRKRNVQHYFFGQQKYQLQNGIHFYTLCQKCNGVLGDPYDKELAAFSKSVRSKIDSFKYLPHYSWGFECKPNLIARSLVGSFLTASRGCVNDSHSDLQNFINNPKSMLPNQLRIGFWLHCYDSVMVQPDFMMVEPEKTPRRVLFMMKYFPLAWILYDQEEGAPDFCQQYNIHDFTQYLDAETDKLVSISVYPTKEKHEFWPWVSDNIAIMIGQNASDNAILGDV